jgi:hypothetical protein
MCFGGCRCRFRCHLRQHVWRRSGHSIFHRARRPIAARAGGWPSNTRLPDYTSRRQAGSLHAAHPDRRPALRGADALVRVLVGVEECLNRGWMLKMPPFRCHPTENGQKWVTAVTHLPRSARRDVENDQHSIWLDEHYAPMESLSSSFVSSSTTWPGPCPASSSGNGG